MTAGLAGSPARPGTDALGLAEAAPLGRRARWLLAGTSAAGVVAFAWPLVLTTSSSADLAHATDAPLVVGILVPLLLALVAAELGDGSLDAKAVAMLGVLAAAGTALRVASAGVAGIEFVFFLLLPAGRVLGRGFGFLLGALTLFASALLTGGVGPWLPFQMLAAGWIGLGAGCLPRRLRGRIEIAALAVYGAAAGLLYGVVMNLWFWPFVTEGDTSVSFDPTAGVAANLRRFWGFHLLTSLAYDIPRAAINAVAVLVVGPAVLAALRRTSARAAFGSVAAFSPPAPGGSRPDDS